MVLMGPLCVFGSSAQLRNVAYTNKAPVFKDVPAEEPGQTCPLEQGQNILELQLVGADLSPSALEVLGDGEPSTFCTYNFHLSELHVTPAVTGPKPRYGSTSEYVVTVDQSFLQLLQSGAVTVELHQALGLDWRTVARGQIHLLQLQLQDGAVRGTVPLAGETLA